jgi:hypothetical protein
MVRLGRTVLIVCALLALAVSAQASTLSFPITIFNTGVDASGSPLPDGAIGDPHYSLVSLPGGTNTLVVRTSAGGFPIGPWIGDDSASAWIRPNNIGNLSTDPEGDYDFQTTLDLSGLIPSTAVLIGQWATDNEGLNILLNGNSTGNTAVGFTRWSSFTIDSGFVAGVNTLDFLVHNDSGGYGNPVGLRVEISGTADSTPEPATLMLIGAGLVALGMVRRRKA